MTDIAPLVDHFIARLAAETGRRIHGITPEALRLLEAYDWPGNIRQLGNAIFRAVVLAETALLQPGDFPQISALVSGRGSAVQSALGAPGPSAPVHIDDAPLVLEARDAISPASDRFLTPEGEIAPLAEIERALIAFALEHHGGHMSRVARSLGIGRSTLYRKLKDYGLTESDEKSAA